MLPLLWMLKRNREEPRVKTVIAPPKPVPLVLPKPVTVSYSDTSTASQQRPPVTEPEIPAVMIPESG